MKRLIQKKLVLMAVMLIGSTASKAHDFSSGGIYYKITSEDDLTVEVTYRGGTPYEYVNEYSSPIVIPETVTYNGKIYSVTSIGSSAFSDCDALRLSSVTIPNSVTSIGNSAFYKCSCLSYINIPESVMSIGNNAFYGTAWWNRQSDGLVYLDNWLLDYKEIKPSGHIDIKEGTKGIANAVFHGCSSLTSVTIPNSVTFIGAAAFKDCSSLTSINIPESVMSIGDNAFYGTAWWNRQSDGLVYLDNWLLGYKGTVPSAHIDIKESTKGIANDVFHYYQCPLPSVSIPNSVTFIGASAFSGCYKLTSINISESVTNIGNRAFEDCSSLTSVVIPNSVTSIGGSTFAGCYSLTSVIIGNSVANIGGTAFEGCSSLTSIKVNEGNSVYDSRDNCNAIIETATNTLVLGCKNTIIPNSVTIIGYRAFYGCNKLTSITIPNSVTSIGDNAFYGCSKLSYVEVADGNTVFEDRDNNRVVVEKATGKVVLGNPRSISFTLVSVTETTITLHIDYEKSNTFEKAYIKMNSSVTYDVDESGNVTITELTPNKDFILGAVAVYDGLSYESREVKCSTKDISAEAIVQSSPTTLTLSGIYDLGDATYADGGFTLPESTKENKLTFTGLEPGTSFNVSYYVRVKEGNYTKTVTQTVTTPALILTTLPAKATSNTKAVICAETNIANEETGTGFEFRRIDAPDLVPSTVVYCAVHDGVMEGILNNLSSNTYYKYRPFYKSASGKMYYGEWIGFGTADAYVYFTPTVHTYATAGVENNSVTLNGYALPGSDDVLEQGFEYWTDGITRAAANGVQTVTATGQRMTITLNDLQYNTTYRYRAYVKTAKETTYGEEMTFTTGADPSGIGELAAEELDVEVRILSGGSLELRLSGAETTTARYALYTPNGVSVVVGELTSVGEWQPIGDSSLSQGLYLLRMENNKLCRTVKVLVK